MTATQLQQHTNAIADQINSHAEQATSKAGEAVQHAIEAGKLLIEVKASLAHGQFGAWLESNVTVTARQARRYIAAAEGKPSPIRAISAIKSDTVSVLAHDDAEAKPTWEPIPGHQMMATQGGVTYWVTESLEHRGYFHFTKMFYTGATEFTAKPCSSVAVEMFLEHFGLKDPAQQAWTITPIEGGERGPGNVVLPPVQAPAAGVSARC